MNRENEETMQGFTYNRLTLKFPGTLENAYRDAGEGKLTRIVFSAVIITMMVFVLLYVPCFATVVAIAKETSAKWAWFNIAYTTMVAWGASFLVYHAGMILYG